MANTQGNSPREALDAQTDQTQEIETLRARLAEYEAGKVVAPQFRGEIPKYKLNNTVFLEDETLHFEGDEIDYLGVPNMEMVPMNDAARQRMGDYIREQTACAREAAFAKGRPFVGLVVDQAQLIAENMQHARQTATKVEMVQMPEEKGIVYPMPNIPEAQAQARRRGRPPKSDAVVGVKTPPPPTRKGLMPEDIIGSSYTRDATKHRAG